MKTNFFITGHTIHRKALHIWLILLSVAAVIYMYAAWKPHLLQMPFALRLSYFRAYAAGLVDRMPEGQTEPSSAYATSVPVILYHGVWAQQNAEDGTNVDFRNFVDQIRMLKEAGYHTLSLQEFLDFMQGKAQVPDRSLLITFDDGRKDSYYPADPILAAAGFRASMAVITGRTKDKSDFHLTVDELKIMRDSGRWDFMSHGMNDHDLYQISPTGAKGHFMSNRLWLKEKSRLETDAEFNSRINHDLAQSRKDLEGILGTPVFAYALPFSDYGQDSASYPGARTHVLNGIVSNYSLGFYEMWPGGDFLANYPNTGPFIKRISVDPGWSGNDLVNLLESIRDKKPDYPAGTLPGTISLWSRNWGILQNQAGYLRLAATPVTSGAAAFLDGTRNWKDYSVGAKVDWNMGNSIQITARMRDNDNYVACVFFDDHVQVQQSLSGNQRVIKGVVTGPGNSLKKDLAIGLDVSGRKVQCRMGDKVVVATDFLDTSLDRGGIGFKIWDPSAGNSEMTVKEISVTVPAVAKP